MKRSTNLVVIAGPSGAGKDAIIEELIKRGLPIERVITTISRSKRPGEVEGRVHYFASKEEMERKIENKKLAEWANVYGNLYGVTIKELERVQSLKDKIGIWRIEEQGVRTARKRYPDILAIGIEAPREDLMRRSVGRGDEEEQIAKRAESKKEWTGDENLYDYKVENKEGGLEEAVDKVVAILKKEGYLV